MNVCRSQHIDQRKKVFQLADLLKAKYSTDSDGIV